MIINRLEHANDYLLHLPEARKKENDKQFFLIRAVSTVFNQALNLLKCIFCISNSNEKPQKTRQYTKLKPEKSARTHKKKSHPRSQPSQAQVAQFMNLVGNFAQHAMGEGNKNASRASNGAELVVKQKIKKSLYTWEKERGISRRQRDTRKILSICILKAFDERWPSLNLSTLRLTSLPDCFHHLQHLEVLDISNNRIKIIPDSVYQLRNLKILYLNNNEIEHIKENILCMPNLKKLYISKNPEKSVSTFVELYLQVDYYNQFSYNRFKTYLDKNFDTNTIYQKIDDSQSNAVWLRNQIRCWMILNHDFRFLRDKEIDHAFRNLMNHPGSSPLVTYLTKMKESKDFQIDGNRAPVVDNICKQILSANENEAFRNAFFDELHAYTTECSDQTTAGYVYFNILRKAHCENLDSTQLFYLLLGLYRYQQLDLVVAQSLFYHNESMEKFLNALVMLKDALQIPVDVKNTLFADGHREDFVCTEEELTLFCEQVLNLSSTKEQWKDILVKSPIWQQKMLERCPQCAKIKGLFAGLMEEVNNFVTDDAFNHEAFNAIIRDNPMLRVSVLGNTGHADKDLSEAIKEKLENHKSLNSDDIDMLGRSLIFKQQLTLNSLVRYKTDQFLKNLEF